MTYLTRAALMATVVILAACDAQNVGLLDDNASSQKTIASTETAEIAMLKGKSGDQTLLAQVRAATAKYHDVSVAEDDGYVSTVHCVSNPFGEGAMGVHYVNFGLINGVPDVPQPEVLVYEPMKNGRMRLVAVEWVVPAALVEDAPVLFGQTFDGPFVRDPNAGPQYELHAWIWRHNPDGLHLPFNPNVSCPTAE